MSDELHKITSEEAREWLPSVDADHVAAFASFLQKSDEARQGLEANPPPSVVSVGGEHVAAFSSDSSTSSSSPYSPYSPFVFNQSLHNLHTVTFGEDVTQATQTTVQAQDETQAKDGTETVMDEEAQKQEEEERKWRSGCWPGTYWIDRCEQLKLMWTDHARLLDEFKTNQTHIQTEEAALQDTKRQLADTPSTSIDKKQTEVLKQVRDALEKKCNAHVANIRHMNSPYALAKALEWINRTNNDKIKDNIIQS